MLAPCNIGRNKVNLVPARALVRASALRKFPFAFWRITSSFATHSRQKKSLMRMCLVLSDVLVGSSPLMIALELSAHSVVGWFCLIWSDLGVIFEN